jgi:hypothetical protein
LPGLLLCVISDEEGETLNLVLETLDLVKENIGK